MKPTKTTEDKNNNGQKGDVRVNNVNQSQKAPKFNMLINT